MRKETAINYAKRMHSHHKLTLPVDVEHLAKKYANLRFEEFPIDIDGVAANLKQRGKTPTILVNKDRPKSRKRFTLAHEIGHVVMPWHMGTICDITNENLVDGSQEYLTMEAEANAFATELLMPTIWIQRLLDEHENLATISQIIVKNGGVSPIAATLRLRAMLPAGYLFIVMNSKESITYAGRSDGTYATPPNKGDGPDAIKRLSYASDTYTFTAGTNTYFWFKLPDEIELEGESDGDWRLLLDTIVKEITRNTDEQIKYKQKVNGVLGYANSLIGKGAQTEKSLYSACVQRFANNSALDPITKHKKFKNFLASKIRDLMSKI
ncbi:ImmA/IrrE family metallo-endopeptidase [Pseudomonas sichuanensis]|uniref:ImmA/IrrE family metallo-endopeptidase n=1 Tax=Pseudomonas sichuanensis TaxID=2213015 RepID=UPI00382F10E9